MPKVNDIYNFIDKIAPFSLQEEWDNSGFLVGESEKEVKKVLVCLDCTEKTVKQAVELSCDLIVSHHPIIFKAQKSFTDNNPAYLAAKNGLSVICAHTSYDFAVDGVSDTLAKTLGLKNIRKSQTGEYTMGEVNETTVFELAKSVKEKLDASVCFCNEEKTVKTVAVCGGAGFEFIFDAKNNGADAYITGESDHHEFLDAISLDIGLITAGHFETEVIAVKPLKEKLEKEFADVEFILAQQSSPIKHI